MQVSENSLYEQKWSVPHVVDVRGTGHVRMRDHECVRGLVWEFDTDTS